MAKLVVFFSDEVQVHLGSYVRAQNFIYEAAKIFMSTWKQVYTHKKLGYGALYRVFELLGLSSSRKL